MVGVRKVQRRGRRLHGQPPAHDASWARSPRRLSEKSDEGFTLIELLIVLVILPLVVGAITMVLITTLKNDQSVQGTVADSNAATDSSAFYVRDIQSAAAVTTTASPSAPAPCGAGGAGFLLGLQLQGTVAPAAPSEVSYYESTPGGGPPELVREYCTNGSSTPQSREILSDNVSTTNPPTAVVNCASPTPTSIPTGVTCDPGHDWTPSYMLSTVSLNVTQGCSTVGACAPYQYSLTGDPQSGVPIPPLNEPCGVLTLLGTGPDINLGYNVLGNEALNAQGPIVLNSGYNTGGDGSAAITTQFPLGTESVSATATSSCPNVPAADAIGVYNCQNTSSAGSSTNFVVCPTSGSHDAVASGISPSPNPVQISLGPNQTSVLDPLLAWANQYPVPPVSGTGGCSTQGSTVTCTPGVYSSVPSIPSNTVVKFGVGDYDFAGSANCSGTPTSLCIPSNDTVYFGTGHYTFANGIDVSGSNNALCGGLAATSDCPNSVAGGGVFFYVQAGYTNLGSEFSSTAIQLASITSGNDHYQNVLLWQDGSDNNQVVLDSPDNSRATNTLQGEIYAPTARVLVNGYGGNVATKNIVANTLSFNLTGLFNSLTLTVTPVPSS